MKLHRTDTKPDWENAESSKRNRWQQLAATTSGAITPGNIVTFIGIGLVGWGLFAIVNEQYWWGSGLIIIGRLCDLLDGWLAEATSTKSPLGELLDATIDKLGTILTIAVFYYAALAPWWALTLLLLPHIMIIFISLRARRSGVTLHPSKKGKLSMAILWVALFGLVLAKALEWPVFSIGTVIVYITALLSILLGMAAASGYVFNRD